MGWREGSEMKRKVFTSLVTVLFSILFLCVLGIFFLMKKQQWNKLSRHLDGI